MKTLVLYYSRTGNNRYLAERIAGRLDADIEPIRPRLGGFPFQLLLSFLPVSLGIRHLKADIRHYDRLIVCGPIWTGQLIAPLRSALKRYGPRFEAVDFVTCCGSNDEQKDDRFGYSQVFRQVHALLGRRCRQCVAFPVRLSLPEDQRDDDQVIMSTRLSDAHFGEALEQRLEAYLSTFDHVDRQSAA